MALVAISLTSCLGGENESSPVIYVPGLKAYRTSAEGVKDTIRFTEQMYSHVGDTIRVPMILDGGYNTLTSFTVTADTSAIGYKFICDSMVLNILQADSRPEEGYLHFQNDYQAVGVVFWYVSKKLGDYDIVFSLASTASQKYSPKQTTVKQKVVSAD